MILRFVSGIILISILQFRFVLQKGTGNRAQGTGIVATALSVLKDIPELAVAAIPVPCSLGPVPSARSAISVPVINRAEYIYIWSIP